jgi:predicted enzyme related to lactoylglutathione lyase
MQDNFQGEVRVVFFTNQFDKMSDFYKNILGLPVFKTFDHGEFQRGTVFELNKTLIELLEKKNGVISQTDSYLYIEKNNVKDFFEQIKSKVIVIKEIETFSWGHTSFVIEDPEGNKLKFFSQNQ